MFREMNIEISGETLLADSTPPLTIDTSSAGTYTCNVTINGGGSSTITGSSASGQGMAQITAQSK